MINFLLGIVLTIIVANIIVIANKFIEEKKLRDLVVPGNIDRKKLCRSQHSWLEAPFLTTAGQENLKLCRSCGLIDGTDKMLGTDGVDQMEEQLAKKAEDERFLKEFLEKEDKEIIAFFEEELSEGLSLEKLTKLHAAGTSFTERYELYKKHRTEEKGETRGNA